jgi:hypothetical protein
MSDMKEINNVIGLIVVALIIIILYLVVLGSIVFCFSFISFLGIKLFSWTSVFAFSFYVMIWSIPFEVISFLMDIRIKNKSTKKVIWLATIILNFIGFTIFVIWLDSHLDGIQFSSTGLVCYIIIIAILVNVINTCGNRLKEADYKQKSASF